MTQVTSPRTADTPDTPDTPDTAKTVEVDAPTVDPAIVALVPDGVIGHLHWDAFSFTVDGKPSGIRLEQNGPGSFGLACAVRYHGETGLERLDALTPEAEETLRTVDSLTLPETDLASVPAPFRWWTNTYGVHSPAALIHDRFIGEPADGDDGRPDGITERHIDRYFRFMLKASGVPFFRRWLMWAAVAARTRFISSLVGKITLVAWFALTVLGIGWAVRFGTDGEWLKFTGAFLLPAVASGLWARQIGAGLMMAYIGVPCLLPPSLVSVPFLVLYVIVEAIGKQVGRSYRYLSTDATALEPPR